MSSELPRSAYRRPSSSVPQVIDLGPPPQKPKRWGRWLVLVTGFALTWLYRDEIRSVGTGIQTSFRQAFPSSETQAGLAVTKPRALPPPVVKVMETEAPMPVDESQKLVLKSIGPPAKSTMPPSVAIMGTPEVTVVVEDPAAKKFIYRTPHYEFQSDVLVGADAVRTFSRIFEATFLVNCLLPFDYRPSPEEGRERFVARLFSSDFNYFAEGGMPGSAGAYSRTHAALLAPISSLGIKMVNDRMQVDRSESTEVLVHEITHQMMNPWLEHLPMWFSEGAADYVAMADYVHGKFVLNQMDNRLRLYLKRRQPWGNPPDIRSIPELMGMSPQTWNEAVSSIPKVANMNYSSATMLVYYFYHLDGRGDGAGVKAYLRAIEAGTPEVIAAEKHLLRERTIEVLEADVLNAFLKISLPLGVIQRGGLRWRPSPKPVSAATPSR